MIEKSALRAAVVAIIEEHEVEDGRLAEDLVDRLVQEFGEDIYLDEEEDAEESPEFLGSDD